MTKKRSILVFRQPERANGDHNKPPKVKKIKRGGVTFYQIGKKISIAPPVQ